MEKVILVDEQDVEIGTMSKLEAHQKGALHRAFSVFIFNSKGEMLLQQRAFEKYHSGGLWSNACCSHPAPGETAIGAAHRRLMEEMGIQSPLKHVYAFIYKVKLENDLSEHELDHVFWGICDEEPKINKSEISNWKYVPIAELRIAVKENPQLYTEWFKLCLDQVLEAVPFTEIW